MNVNLKEEIRSMEASVKEASEGWGEAEGEIQELKAASRHFKETLHTTDRVNDMGTGREKEEAALRLELVTNLES